MMFSVSRNLIFLLVGFKNAGAKIYEFLYNLKSIANNNDPISAGSFVIE